MPVMLMFRAPGYPAHNWWLVVIQATSYLAATLHRAKASGMRRKE
jgi:hypothetical protein